MQPINISVTPAVKVNMLEYSLANVDPVEDYSLILVTTTQDGFNFKQEFWMKNTVLPLTANNMKDIRTSMRLKVMEQLKEHARKVHNEAN